MQKKLDLMKTPEGEGFLLISKTFTEYRIYSNERPGCSTKKGVLRNFAEFTEKHLCQSLFFN